MAATMSETICWLHVDVVEPTPLFCDNVATRDIANNPAFLERTKRRQNGLSFCLGTCGI